MTTVFITIPDKTNFNNMAMIMLALLLIVMVLARPCDAHIAFMLQVPPDGKNINEEYI